MRTLAVAIAGVCVLWPQVARGENAAELAMRGEQLAKEGRLSEAIELFKQADKIEPRAKHACLIALAYTRRELWPQAEVFLATCHERAGVGDPLPDWVPLAEKQLGERLQRAKVAAVEIRVEPSSVKARIGVSSFAPDETFAPRTIHLNQGRHLITATAEGHEPAQETIEITSSAPRKVVIKFEPTKPTVVDRGGRGERSVPTPAGPKQRSRVVPWSMILGGLAIGVVGGVYHVGVMKPVRDRLEESSKKVDPVDPNYERHASDFRGARAVTAAIYGAGAVVLLTGVVLRMTVYKTRESSVRVSAQPTGDGGAFVGLEWRR